MSLNIYLVSLTDYLIKLSEELRQTGLSTRRSIIHKGVLPIFALANKNIRLPDIPSLSITALESIVMYMLGPALMIVKYCSFLRRTIWSADLHLFSLLHLL